MTEQEQAALLREIEERLLDPSVRRSRDQLSQLLADEFVEIGCSGRIHDKEGTIQALAGEQFVGALPIADITDYVVRSLGPDAVLLTYRLVARSALHGQATSSWRCSIWRLIDHRWQVIFHQGTPIPSGSAL